MEPLLRSRFPTPTAETALHIPSGLSASSIVSLKAEHIDAYRTGHAFKYATHQWDCFQEGIWNWNLMAYANGIMAWVDRKDGHVVKSLDLKTGQEWYVFFRGNTFCSVAIRVIGHLPRAKSSFTLQNCVAIWVKCHVPTAKGLLWSLTMSHFSALHQETDTLTLKSALGRSYQRPGLE